MIQKYNLWFKKNWFSVLSIFLIIGVVMWDLSQVQNEKLKLVKECNQFWKEQVKYVCPSVYEGDFQPDYNFSGWNFSQDIVSQ